MELLKSDGELLIQCGGKGNLGTIPSILEKVMESTRFKCYFKNWKDPWNFASTADTINILDDTGFKDAQATLIKKTANFENFEEYILFMKTVVMKPHLSYLPTYENNKIKNLFIDEFLNELNKKDDKNTIKKAGMNLKLDYVRLNIIVKK